jgi:hypothetical protein
VLNFIKNDIIYILYHLMSLSLEDLVNNLRTDKNTTHSYLPLYQKLLLNKKSQNERSSIS